VKVRIEACGHVVEIEHEDSLSMGVQATANLAQRVWDNTKGEVSRQPIGYAAQHVERTHDRPVQGAGDHQRQVSPVTA
jgi:hypothetical protein